MYSIQGGEKPQSTQSAGPVRFWIFCSIIIFLLASLVPGRRPQCYSGESNRECTPPYLSTGISNLLQPAQAGVVLGQLSTCLASWRETIERLLVYCHPSALGFLESCKSQHGRAILADEKSVI
jgi:hypothetical protein